MTPSRRRPAPSAALLAALLLLAPARLSAQDASELRREATSAAANVLLGGLTSGLWRSANGGSFREGFVRGAAGGGLVYAGKRVAVERFPAAGVLGRELAAVGSSIVRNAADGRPALERVVLPFGPVRFYVATGGEEVRAHARVDVAGVVAAARFALGDDTRIDWGESLSAAAPVFRRRGTRTELGWDGGHAAGAVVVRDHPYGQPEGMSEAYRAKTTAHERVHVIQYDQQFLFWTAPAEDALLDGSALGRALHRHVDLGLNAPVVGVLNLVVPYDWRPWEREAYLLVPNGRDARIGGGAPLTGSRE
jgi:hypothetical protein